MFVMFDGKIAGKSVQRYNFIADKFGFYKMKTESPATQIKHNRQWD